jgi:hypothetical protein
MLLLLDMFSCRGPASSCKIAWSVLYTMTSRCTDTVTHMNQSYWTLLTLQPTPHIAAHSAHRILQNT